MALQGKPGAFSLLLIRVFSREGKLKKCPERLIFCRRGL
jgi:hypothetical protein